jgi:hypothetical protein
MILEKLYTSPPRGFFFFSSSLLYITAGIDITSRTEPEKRFIILVTKSKNFNIHLIEIRISRISHIFQRPKSLFDRDASTLYNNFVFFFSFFFVFLFFFFFRMWFFLDFFLTCFVIHVLFFAFQMTSGSDSHSNKASA